MSSVLEEEFSIDRLRSSVDGVSAWSMNLAWYKSRIVGIRCKKSKQAVFPAVVAPFRIPATSSSFQLAIMTR